MSTQHIKTASQIELCDPDSANQYRSLYLDTLGSEAVRSGAVSPPRSSGNQPNSHDVEGYIHGTLTTDGIDGAAPAVHSLTKQAIRAKAAKQQADPMPSTEATRSKDEGVATYVTVGLTALEPCMHPKRRHPVVTNRPDFVYNTLDIAGAQPCTRSMFRTPRNTDPLNPAYELPESPTLPLPSGPAPPDKLLCDPLNVADISGATRKPPPTNSNKPSQLDISDIEGSNAQWKPHHRQHVGVKLRDPGLQVQDINTYMAQAKFGPRNLMDKGDADGPKIKTHVKPRHDLAVMDNSLRTADVDGSRAELSEHRVGARQPHNHSIGVDDIEGASPADKDLVHLFERKKAAAAAMVADHEAAQAVLSSLALDPQELAVLWRNCSRLDKDSSGYLTVSELEGAMKASLHLSSAHTQRLLSALKDNAGLLNYKRLTQQLKARVSRPNTASQQQERTLQEPHATNSSPSELQEQRNTASAEGILVDASPPHTAGKNLCPTSKRPQTSPAVTRTGRRQYQNEGSSSPGSHGSSFKTLSHWFGGSNRDKQTRVEVTSWRPGQDVELLLPRCDAPDRKASGSANAQGGSLGKPWIAAFTNSSNTRSCDRPQTAGCTQCKQQGITTSCNNSPSDCPDSVPGWMVGADALYGTFKVSRPFGAAELSDSCNKLKASCKSSTAAAGRTASPAVAQISRSSSAAAAVTHPVAVKSQVQRPVSAGPCCNGSHSNTFSAKSCLDPAAAKAVVGIWNSHGASNILGGSSSSAVSSQWLSGGNHNLALLQGQKCDRMQHKQRARSASAVRHQRPTSHQSVEQYHMQPGRVHQPSSSATAATDTVSSASVMLSSGSLAGQVGRPMSAPLGARLHSVGVAEKRRLVESMHQDLAAVRLLQ